MVNSFRVTFRKGVATDDWRIAAECRGVETVHTKGLKSKTDADEWLSGSRRIELAALSGPRHINRVCWQIKPVEGKKRCYPV